ncbi:hypothetical protein T45_05944 [Streptomyces turgidiscabies]|nr:hypothetical protein T45_05944 [Streptomyces turgidiscabies]
MATAITGWGSVGEQVTPRTRRKWAYARSTVKRPAHSTGAFSRPKRASPLEHTIGTAQHDRRGAADTQDPQDHVLGSTSRPVGPGDRLPTAGSRRNERGPGGPRRRLHEQHARLLLQPLRSRSGRRLRGAIRHRGDTGVGRSGGAAAPRLRSSGSRPSAAGPGGGGNELTLALDLRHASREHAVFGHPEVRLLDPSRRRGHRASAPTPTCERPSRNSWDRSPGPEFIIASPSSRSSSTKNGLEEVELHMGDYLRISPQQS